MGKLFLSENYRYEQLSDPGVLIDDARKNWNKLCNMGIGDQVLSSMLKDEEPHLLFCNDISKGMQKINPDRFGAEKTYNKYEIAAWFSGLSNPDAAKIVFEEFGISQDEFNKASDEMPGHSEELSNNEVNLYEKIDSKELEDHLYSGAVSQFENIKKFGLEDKFADILTMYMGNRAAGDNYGIGSESGPKLQYFEFEVEHSNDFDPIIVDARVANDFTWFETERTFLPIVGISQPEFENNIPGLTDVLSSILEHNGHDGHVSNINNEYSGYFDPEHIFVANDEFADPETHQVIPVCVELDLSNGGAKLNGYINQFKDAELIGSIDLGSIDNVVEVIDSLPQDLSEVLSPEAIRDAYSRQSEKEIEKLDKRAAEKEKASTKRMEDRPNGVRSNLNKKLSEVGHGNPSSGSDKDHGIGD